MLQGIGGDGGVLQQDQMRCLVPDEESNYFLRFYWAYWSTSARTTGRIHEQATLCYVRVSTGISFVSSR